MHMMIQDILNSLREFKSRPFFTAFVILTLSLGIAVSTAVYSLLDQLVLRVLPVPESNELVMLQFSGAYLGRLNSYGGSEFTYFSFPEYRLLRDNSSGFQGLIASAYAQAGLSWHNNTELVDAELVTGNYFDVLGLVPAAGRVLHPSDARVREGSAVVVLSHSYWVLKFNANPAIIGQHLLINGYPFTVVGVTKAPFRGMVVGRNPAIFVPLTMQSEIIPGRDDLANWRSRWLNIFGRLQPGVTRQHAEAFMQTVWRPVREADLATAEHVSGSYRERFLQSHLTLLDSSRGFSPLREVLTKPIIIIMSMACFITLIACLNVGGLLLVNISRRERQFTIRHALGAPRISIVRQVLAEGIIMSLSGGAVGLLFAPMMTRTLAVSLSNTAAALPFLGFLDRRIFLFNVGLSILVGVLFSVTPCVLLAKPQLMELLKEQVATPAARSNRVRQMFICVQIALSILLLAGASLFAQVFFNLRSVGVGYSTERLVTFRVDLALAGYAPDHASSTFPELIRTLENVPGVREVGATSDPELSGESWGNIISVPGYVQKPGENMIVEWPAVSTGYFSTLGIRTIAGRTFDDQDNAASYKVAVINDSCATHYFGAPGAAVDRYLTVVDAEGKKALRIVGVVADTKHRSVKEEVSSTVFRPYLQDPAVHSLALYVRTTASPESMMQPIRSAIQRFDPKITLARFETMEQQIGDNLSAERVIAKLAAVYGTAALVLAAIGLYAALAYVAAQRVREIAIRMALGASRRNAALVVLSEAFRLAAMGGFLGLLLALIFVHLVRSQVSAVSHFEASALAGAIVLVEAVSFAAALVPAIKAARANPVQVLRYE